MNTYVKSYLAFAAFMLITGVIVRPLVKSGSTGRTADLSRRHKVVASPSGVVSVTGGKLTTYREMSADTIDEVVEVLGNVGSG